MDGVLYQWDKTARYMLRTEFGYPKDGPLGQPSTHWNAIQDHVSKDHWQWLWGRGVKNGLFRYGHLYKGAIEGVRNLANLGDVVVITHRPRSAVQDTLDWLSYLRLPFTEIHLLTNREPKSSVPHCDLYVDDKPENVDDYAANTHRLPLLWVRPWNTAHLEGYATGKPYYKTNNFEGKWTAFPAVESWGEVIERARELQG